jgi:hypothetical protein
MVPERGLEPPLPCENELLKLNWTMSRRPPSGARFCQLMCYQRDPRNPSLTQYASESRRPDFRVDVRDAVHARACGGGSIALAQSDSHDLAGTLPNGEKFTGRLRVARPHALVLLKFLALSDRYSNIRGPREARHDLGRIAGCGPDIHAREMDTNVKLRRA